MLKKLSLIILALIILGAIVTWFNRPKVAIVPGRETEQIDVFDVKS